MTNNIFGDDFQDFIRALNDEKVDYILVGGYSVILHGYNRTTGDMDIWVRPTAENYRKLARAFKIFGMPMFDMTEAKFLNHDENDVFSFGRPPVEIDIMTAVKGLVFEQVFDRAEWFEVENDLKVKAIRLADLIEAKKAANRPKDQDDLLNLNKKLKK